MMEHKSTKSWAGALFGLIFLIAGLGAAYGSAGKMIVGYLGSIGWEQVPTQIHDIELVRNYGDTTTYSVKSQYSYYYNGVQYTNNRVSLSSGSDNIGKYWQNLERTLRTRQRNNNAVAFVKPGDPRQALLDRTIRGKSIVFGSIFLLIFGGIGSFIMWASLRNTPTPETQAQKAQTDGITCDQKNHGWIIAAFGSIFFIMGTGMALIILPDAIRDGKYGALAILIFSFAGAGMIYHGYKVWRAFKRFGPTPMFLDPVAPGIGGQLGGCFKVAAPDVNLSAGMSNNFQAILSCARTRKSGDSTSRSIKWQKEAPVYIKDTSNGVEASFLFEIPEDCTPTKKWSKGSSIDWSVSIEGNFGDSELGKFERSWEIIVQDTATQVSNVLAIPQSFLHDAKQKTAKRVKASSQKQVPVTEDDEYINVDSKAGRGIGEKLFMIAFGAIFSTVGIFALQSWWPGYIFLLVGASVLLGAIYFLGKSIEVKIDKASWVLYTRESWFGFVYSHREGDVVDAEQFTIKLTSSTTSGNKLTEYYAVYSRSNGKKIRLADGIAGKQEAQALRDAIAERCFPGEPLADAA